MSVNQSARDDVDPHNMGTPGADVETSAPDLTTSDRAESPTVLDAIRAGDRYAVVCGGQGADWVRSLTAAIELGGLSVQVGAIVDRAAQILAPVAGELALVAGAEFDPLGACAAADDADGQASFTDAARSVPGILVAQIASILLLRQEGLDGRVLPPRSVSGHSQGVLAAELFATDADMVETAARQLALAQLIGACGALIAHRVGLVTTGAGRPMMVVAGCDPARVDAILAEFVAERGADVGAPVRALRNGRQSVVLSGNPADLREIRRRCTDVEASEVDLRTRKVVGGQPFSPTFDEVDASIAFHHPALAPAVEMVADLAGRCGLDVSHSAELAAAVLRDPVDWVAQMDELDEDVRWIVDLGPADDAARLSASVVRGRGIGVIAAATRSGQRNLFTPGGVPEVAQAWSHWAPRLVELPDGRRVVETAFTRLTGRSPILLAGMTPTTVDPAIVAAAANAGHWAELAGGGQVTEEVFAENLARLEELLDDGRQAEFNALFLDPYLWRLQLGAQRLVPKARAAGAPIDGVVVSAGVPELDDAVDLVSELADAGIEFVAFKPGTVEQIRAVVRIAAEVTPHKVIVQIEGGRAGGHHSWEDLDDLLIATYGELRSRPNVVLCVGGGIGTPEVAARYLTGTWARDHGYPDMPVDGILVGTAAMACREATTSPQVKELLVQTPGCDDWIGAGTAAAGMASGRSQLGADIHEVDNAASACGRLLDEVAGDAEAIAQRREEIVEALASTAKPYFGDAATMTYTQWLTRYADLAVGQSGGWADISWQRRYLEMLHRAEARLHPADGGEIDTQFPDMSSTEDPYRAVARLRESYPAADVDVLHPADVAFFLGLCRTPGKPVNFVPTIDADVRRWWRSDSLWQAHDARYGADEVAVIPGPVAVAGITRVDEPVGDLLDRFEAYTAGLLTGPAEPADSRRVGTRGLTGPSVALLASSHVWWAGRTVANPARRLGPNHEWNCDDHGGSVHPPTGAVLTPIDGGVRLSVPIATPRADIDTPHIDIDIALDASMADGGCPRVTQESATAAMTALLTAAAGGTLATVSPDGVATDRVRWEPDTAIDHTLATGSTLPDSMTPGGRFAQRRTDALDDGIAIPDTLVGLAWPAVFGVLGVAEIDGIPVCEGLLDLVHLDHAIAVRSALPRNACDLDVTARLIGVEDTTVGRVVTVSVSIDHVSSDGEAVPSALVEFTERFAVRGRLGSADPADPLRAGGSVVAERESTRKKLLSCAVSAPLDMRGFAAVSGDHNPIHTNANAARLAGLGEPIVHGMWLSACAQQAVTAASADGAAGGRRMTGWTARFLGMVRTGDTVTIRADRVGVDAGAEIVEVTATVDGVLVMVATARLVAPRTVYAFPGQGIQSAGMGLAACSRSAAAREVWERADAHTRAALGFSIMAIVRDNPTRLVADGVVYTHPDGVLFLTQFTQVAMAMLGVAQIAELNEAGCFVEGALTCGHSVGEYNALAACAGVLPLESVLEVVFHRGSAMHHLVPRDAQGRSNYRMAAIRPSQFGLDDDEVVAFVTQVGERCGEFLEVVNLNLRGSQYAIAGTIRGLEVLEAEIDRRRAEFGGRRAFILVPGIDVPFHSSVLREGVPAFREHLRSLLPDNIDPAVLVGRYIPNLVAKTFSLERDFVCEIGELVPSEPIEEVLADWENWSRRPGELARVVLIELLAWQFASPVRWIETQDLMFTPLERGGLGVERFVEVGVASAPTLAGLATNTVRLMPEASVSVVNLERDADLVFGRDAGVPDDEIGDAPAAADESPATTADEAVPAPAATSPEPTAAGGPRPADLSFGAGDGARTLVAWWSKIRTDQIGAADTIEALCDGVSSRRNQLLMDLGTELGLGAIDGAAEADIPSLAATVEALAHGYRPLGPVLRESVDDQLRKVVGPAGKRATYIAERVSNVWELGPGWALHTTVAIALGTRDGVSVRGGELANLLDGPINDVSGLEALIDRAVASVGAAVGIPVSKPAAASSSDAVVDAGVVADLAEAITGRNGVLATSARAMLASLGLDTAPAAPEREDALDTELISLLDTELGSEWRRVVAGAFDARRAVLIDDRWASAREDLAALWLIDDCGVENDFDELTTGFSGCGQALADQATWWQGRALSSGRLVHARAFGAIAHAAQDPEPGSWHGEVAVVTGAARGSIAAAVVGQLLAGGAQVIATTSSLDDIRLQFFRDLYRRHARPGAALWVLPANMASFADIDALIDWIGSEQTENAGGVATVTKPALRPTLAFPFAAPRVFGDATESGPRTETQMRILLWSVERLITGLGALGADHDIDARLHVILPGSPNRGMFGGDGAYGEAKAGLDALVSRWKAESSWNQQVTLAHALIGWVRGTGLMGHNDPMVTAVEAAGVRTWSTAEMAGELLALATPDRRRQAREHPVLADLTAGLDAETIDLTAIAAQVRDDVAEGSEDATAADDVDGRRITALPAPARVPEVTHPQWPSVSANPEDLVVIVGAGELGPYGSCRTRFEVEVSDELSAAGVAELAWATGLIAWQQTPAPGWYDAGSGEPVDEADIAGTYRETVMQRCGIRRYADDGAMQENSAPLMASVFLDADLTFGVGGEDQARAFLAAAPETTTISRDPETGDWSVTRAAGTEIRVPRRFELSRTVGGQIPTGFDPTRWGVTADMAASIDRVALWNLVATVDAFLSSGFSPAELMRWVHPGLVANTQGTGMGGMTSMRSLYIDTLLGEAKANDILQEALPNVVAAHVVQSYIGSYGAMIHPVAACATAAVSVEEGVDKIRLGKAEFVVAGGFDDLGIEGVVGFGDMSATAESAAMTAKGISDRRFSRANDRRRSGFVESQGGGTILLARGDVAVAMGLPVLGVVAWAQSFGDGMHTSIPAPGLGALGAARGSRESGLARSLRQLGLGADDIAFVSKHDTSTRANDPNESVLHERLAEALGRSDGAPMFVVSQKSLTGHAKGGAAAFSVIGACQAMRSGVIPGNRSLDCVDDALAEHRHLVWPTRTLQMGAQLPLRAALVTSLGFGHVSGLIALAHPEAFLACLAPEVRADYLARARERERAGVQSLLEMMCGGAPGYRRSSGRRFGTDEHESDLEAALLLDPSARLAGDGNYLLDAQVTEHHGAESLR
ncbi:type I polyketide synthase [Gordonia jinhuaensis]